MYLPLEPKPPNRPQSFRFRLREKCFDHRCEAREVQEKGTVGRLEKEGEVFVFVKWPADQSGKLSNKRWSTRWIASSSWGNWCPCSHLVTGARGAITVQNARRAAFASFQRGGLSIISGKSTNTSVERVASNSTGEIASARFPITPADLDFEWNWVYIDCSITRVHVWRTCYPSSIKFIFARQMNC